ncbi:hypothetical protein TWF788_007154 [Orbilia oligospora]|uniref:DUF7707 domain-containing protein n=1 Tax=Orbilia oligospora TaxID=2813651 RepID=A0A7C8TSK3_ORBOL|nr:hypothetical protein TWF788_007154 [Orbilia oligospora]
MYFSTSVVVALASLLSAVSAQTYYPVDPEEIDLGTKQTWCLNQISSCGLLCLDQKSGSGFVNDCDVETLQYQCICADNTVPNATEYSQTIPYFLCTYQVQNCIQNCGQFDPTCAENCRTGRFCGASNPTRATSTASGSDKTTSAPEPSRTSSDDDGDDDAAYDAKTTDKSASKTTGPADDDDAPAETGGSKKEDKPSSAIKIGSSYTFSIMLLSILCGAFVSQL